MEPLADKSSIYRRDTGINDSGNYNQEVQACLSGRTHQARGRGTFSRRSAAVDGQPSATGTNSLWPSRSIRSATDLPDFSTTERTCSIDLTATPFTDSSTSPAATPA